MSHITNRHKVPFVLLSQFVAFSFSLFLLTIGVTFKALPHVSFVFVRQIDPAEQDSRNDLSHYTVDGQTLWGHAYSYCTAEVSSSLACYEGSRFEEAANETLPGLLQSADGTLKWPDYVEQVRGESGRMKRDYPLRLFIEFDWFGGRVRVRDRIGIIQSVRQPFFWTFLDRVNHSLE